jgi:hypothetical protein
MIQCSELIFYFIAIFNITIVAGPTFDNQQEQQLRVEQVIFVDDDDLEQEEEANESADNSTSDLNAPVGVDGDTAAMEKRILEAVIHIKKLVLCEILSPKRSHCHDHNGNMMCPTMKEYIDLLPTTAKNGSTTLWQRTTVRHLLSDPCKDVSYAEADGVEADHLFFHCYKEGNGAKGGINVASMIMKTFKNIIVLKHDSEGNPIKRRELELVMVNSGGQSILVL